MTGTLVNPRFAKLGPTATDEEVIAAWAAGEVLEGDSTRSERVNGHAVALYSHGVPIALLTGTCAVLNAKPQSAIGKCVCRYVKHVAAARAAAPGWVVESDHDLFVIELARHASQR